MVARRRGSIVVLAAFFLVVLVAFLALSLDAGMMHLARTDLQHAADAAALAGAADLHAGQSAAAAAAAAFATQNLGFKVQAEEIEFTYGVWNRQSRSLVSGAGPIDAMQVRLIGRPSRLSFGQALGYDSFATTAQATAMLRPRDIMLALDFSGSMNAQRKIESLKEATALFFSILGRTGDQDRVGFVRYSTDAELTFPLSNDYDAINAYVQAERADGWTNIGMGLQLAREELRANGRPNAHRMIVLLSDGNANRPVSRSPQDYVLEQAHVAAGEGVQLLTISFGSDTDKNLMIQVAEIGNGPYFDIEGGIRESEEQLRLAFEKIAARRPILLVD